MTDLKPISIEQAEIPYGTYRLYSASSFTPEKALADFAAWEGQPPLVIYSVKDRDGDVFYWVSADPDVLLKESYREKAE